MCWTSYCEHFFQPHFQNHIEFVVFSKGFSVICHFQKPTCCNHMPISLGLEEKWSSFWFRQEWWVGQNRHSDFDSRKLDISSVWKFMHHSQNVSTLATSISTHTAFLRPSNSIWQKVTYPSPLPQTYDPCHERWWWHYCSQVSQAAAGSVLSQSQPCAWQTIHLHPQKKSPLQ